MELPATPLAPVEVDSAALTAALAQHDALEIAYRALAAEAGEAHNRTHAAAVAVDRIVDSVQDAEARQIVNEFIAAIEITWQLEDRLKAIFDLDAKRQHPRLRELRKALNARRHRRNRELARDPQLIEEWKWQHFLVAQTEREMQEWQNYAARLSNDPNASFDAREESTQ